MKCSIFTFIIFQKKLHWQKENEALRCELLVLKNQARQCESNDVMERNVATQCDEEMLARDTAEQENSFHKWTDEYKLSLGAELEKNFYLPHEAGNCGQNMNEVVASHPIADKMLDIKVCLMLH